MISFFHWEVCHGDSLLTFESNQKIQVLFSAPNQCNPNQFFPIGDGFGLFIIFKIN